MGMFVMALYYHGVPLSVLDSGLRFIRLLLRWIFGLGLQLWPIVSGWIQKQVKTKDCIVDEKWIKIRNGIVVCSSGYGNRFADINLTIRFEEMGV